MEIGDPVEFGMSMGEALVYFGVALFFLFLLIATLRPHFAKTVPPFPTGFQPPSTG